LANADMVVSVSRPATDLRGGDRGCSSIGNEEGSMETPGARPARIQDHALHSAMLGPCCPEKQFPGLLPSTEAGAIRRTVLASKEATPPQGVRGEGRQKAWLLGVISRPVSNPVGLVRTLAVSARARTGRTRNGWRHPERENEVARSPVPRRWCRSPGRHTPRERRVGATGNGRAGG